MRFPHSSQSKVVNRTQLKNFLQTYKLEIAVVCSLAMVYGFLAGRAILSLGMFLFFLNAIWDAKWTQIKEQKYWLWGMIWVAVYALSFFWSEDIPYWTERFRTKYAFVILPLAFGLLPQCKQKHLDFLGMGLFTLASAGCIYSLSFYFKDQEHVLQGYFFSKLFVTPAYKDHIRFSIFIAWCVIWLMFLFRSTQKKIIQIMCVLGMLFFSLYLHILSARSGLMMLYSFALLYIFFLFLRQQIVKAVAIIFVLCAGLFVAYQSLPSFRLKMQYAAYNYQEFKNGNRNMGYSDIGRLVSYQLALKAIQEHPWVGVGAGDIRTEMKNQFEQHAPQAKPEERIVPHNQFLEVLLVGGILAFAPFLVWLLLPLKKVKRNRVGFYILATWFGLILCMMVEAMLEVQFGVFVYLFSLLWIIKASERPIAIPSTPNL